MAERLEDLLVVKGRNFNQGLSASGATALCDVKDLSGRHI